MKGLMIKDFRLMKNLKKTFLIVFAAAFWMAMYLDVSSIVSYLMVLGIITSLGTISYDEFDNGNAFLFSLPVTRKDYVVEKYSFCLIISGGAWLLALLCAVAINMIKNETGTADLMLESLVMLPVYMVILAIVLPSQLKFENEQRRVVMFVIFGLLFILIFAGAKIISYLSVDVTGLLQRLSAFPPALLIAVAVLVCGLLLLLSFGLSVRIVNKKEF